MSFSEKFRGLCFLTILGGCTPSAVLLSPPDRYEDDEPYELVVVIVRKNSLREFEPRARRAAGETEDKKEDEDVEYISLDVAYLGDYDVLETIHGESPGSRVQFQAYDHYGYPEFGRFETVLLYLVKARNQYLHLKYTFEPLFKTRSGDWTTCGPIMGNNGLLLEPKPTIFSRPTGVETSGMSRQEIVRQYPIKYYNHRHGQVYCSHGNTPDSVVKAKIEAGLLDVSPSQG